MPVRLVCAFTLLGMVTLIVACSGSGTGPGSGDASGLFDSPEDCGSCHPQHLQEWQRSMHAYGATDPIMLRLREIAEEMGAGGVGEECIQCHGPSQARAEEMEDPGVDPQDLAEHGLSCDVCHSISEVPPVADISFLADLDPTGAKYGRMTDPVPNEDHPSLHRSFFGSSAICAPCHQVDLPDGVGLENTFREWQQTNLSGMGVECQTCHMKTYTGRAATDSPVREGIHRHTVVGVDYAYAPFQGIDLEAQKADIQDLLENAVSVSVEGIPAEAAPGEALDVVVRVTNDQTGHSIPSGVSFSREMWVSIAVTDSAGASVYRSGYLLANGDLVTVAEDPDLTLFHSKLYDADGERTLLSFVATSIDDSLLLPYMSTRTAHYPVTVPAAASGPLTVEIMLRFRPIAPPILRAIDLPELLPIEIFDMWSASYTVAVTG